MGGAAVAEEAHSKPAAKKPTAKEMRERNGKTRRRGAVDQAGEGAIPRDSNCNSTTRQMLLPLKWLGFCGTAPKGNDSEICCSEIYQASKSNVARLY